MDDPLYSSSSSSGYFNQINEDAFSQFAEDPFNLEQLLLDSNVGDTVHFVSVPTNNEEGSSPLSPQHSPTQQNDAINSYYIDTTKDGKFDKNAQPQQVFPGYEQSDKFNGADNQMNESLASLSNLQGLNNYKPPKNRTELNNLLKQLTMKQTPNQQPTPIMKYEMNNSSTAQIKLDDAMYSPMVHPENQKPMPSSNLPIYNNPQIPFNQQILQQINNELAQSNSFSTIPQQNPLVMPQTPIIQPLMPPNTSMGAFVASQKPQAMVEGINFTLPPEDAALYSLFEERSSKKRKSNTDPSSGGCVPVPQKMNGDLMVHTCEQKMQQLAVKSAAHAALLNVLLTEKNITHLSAKVMNFLCGFFGAELGAIYINDLEQMRSTLQFAFPHVDQFNEYFGTNQNFPAIRTAVAQRKFMQIANQVIVNGLLVTVSWAICPIFSETLKDPPIAVILLGSTTQFDFSSALSYLHEVKPCLTKAITSLVSDRSVLIKQIETLKQQNELLQQKDIFNKSMMVGILSVMEDVSIICTTTKGVITYFSPGAQRLLGYSPQEMIGKKTPLMLHDPKEVMARSMELQQLLGRKIQGFDVLIEYPRMGMSETRIWRYVTKDGTLANVELTVKPLQNPNSNKIMGFIGIAKVLGNTEKVKVEPPEKSQ